MKANRLNPQFGNIPRPRMSSKEKLGDNLARTQSLKFEQTLQKELDKKVFKDEKYDTLKEPQKILLSKEEETEDAIPGNPNISNGHLQTGGLNFMYLRNQFDTFIIKKGLVIENPEVRPGYQEMYKMWGYEQPKIEEKEKEKRYESLLAMYNNMDSNLQHVKAINDHSRSPFLRGPSKIINLLSEKPEREGITEFERMEIPGNNRLQLGRNVIHTIATKIQSVFRGYLSRKKRRDCRYLLRIGNPSFWRAPAEPTPEMRGTANFNLPSEIVENLDRSFFNDLDKLRNTRFDDNNSDIRNFEHLISKPVVSSIPKLDKFTYDMMDCIIQARQPINNLKPPRGKRMIDILIGEKNELGTSIKLDKLDWTVEDSKRIHPNSGKNRKVKHHESIDSFKYSRELSRDNTIDDEIPYQFDRPEVSDRSIPEQFDFSRSKRIKYSHDSRNNIDATQSIEEDIGFEVEGSIEAGSVEWDFGGSKSKSRVSRSRKSKVKFEDNIPIDIEIEQSNFSQQQPPSESESIAEEFRGEEFEFEDGPARESQARQSLSKSKGTFDLNKERISRWEQRMLEKYGNTGSLDQALNRLGNYINENDEFVEKLGSQRRELPVEDVIRRIEGIGRNSRIEEKVDRLLEIENERIYQPKRSIREIPLQKKEISNIVASDSIPATQIDELTKRTQEMIASLEVKMESRFDQLYNLLKKSHKEQLTHQIRLDRAPSNDVKLAQTFARTEFELLENSFERIKLSLLDNFDRIKNLQESIDPDELLHELESQLPEVQKKLEKAEKARVQTTKLRQKNEQYLKELEAAKHEQEKAKLIEKQIIAAKSIEEPIKISLDSIKDAIITDEMINSAISSLQQSGQKMVVSDYPSNNETIQQITWIESDEQSFSWN